VAAVLLLLLLLLLLLAQMIPLGVQRELLPEK
jgi:hypothetical protein